MPKFFALDLIQGQPWWVNGLAWELVDEVILPVSQRIESSHVEAAKAYRPHVET